MGISPPGNRVPADMSETEAASQRSRPVAWYVKFAFALFGAGLASWLFVSVISMPFAGYALFELAFDRPFVVPLLGVLWAPFFWGRLR